MSTFTCNSLSLTISLHNQPSSFNPHYSSIPNPQNIYHPPRPSVAQALPRRLVLTSTYASAVWDAITGGGNSAREASLAIRRGMELFRQGDVDGSVVEFDKAVELDPRQKAYLWQRGLSLYYLDRFEEGAEQFRIDVAKNPNDTEESIWCFLCEVQLFGVEEARRRFLEVGQDQRPVMREAYNMFKDGGDPEKNNLGSAKSHILAAARSLYGSRSDDYMAALAKVHCLLRNWT